MSDTVAVNQILCCLIYCWKYDNGNIKDYKIKKRNHLQKQWEYTQEMCFNRSGFEDLVLEGSHTPLHIEMIAMTENMEVFVFI